MQYTYFVTSRHCVSDVDTAAVTSNPIYSAVRHSPQRHSLRERPAGCSPTRASPERASMRELPSHALPNIPEKPQRGLFDHDKTSFSSPTREASRYQDFSRSHHPQALDARELIPLQKLKLTDVLPHSGMNGGGSPRKSIASAKKSEPFSTFKTKSLSTGEVGSSAVPGLSQSQAGCVHHSDTDSHDHNGNYGISNLVSQTGNEGNNQQHGSAYQLESQNSSFDHSASLNPADVSNTSDYSSRPSSTTSNRELSLYQKLPDPPMSSVSASKPNHSQNLPGLLKTSPAVTLEQRDQNNMAGNKKEVRFAEDYGNSGSRSQDVCDSVEGLPDSEETCTSGSYVLDPNGMFTMGRVNNGAHYEDIPSFSVV